MLRVRHDDVGRAETFRGLHVTVQMVRAVPIGGPARAEGVRPRRPVHRLDHAAGRVLDRRHLGRVHRSGVRGVRGHRFPEHAAAVRHRVHRGRQPEDRDGRVERPRRIRPVRARGRVVSAAVRRPAGRRAPPLLAHGRVVLPAAVRVPGPVDLHARRAQPAVLRAGRDGAGRPESAQTQLLPSQVPRKRRAVQLVL